MISCLWDPGRSRSAERKHGWRRANKLTSSLQISVAGGLSSVCARHGVRRWHPWLSFQRAASCPTGADAQRSQPPVQPSNHPAIQNPVATDHRHMPCFMWHVGPQRWGTGCLPSGRRLSWGLDIPLPTFLSTDCSADSRDNNPQGAVTFPKIS